MEPLRTSARRAGLVALAALLVTGASACSGGTGLVGAPPAATVNDTHIAQSTVDDMVLGSKKMLEAQIDDARSQAGADPAATAQLEAQIEEARAPFERGESTYTTTAGSAALTDLIVAELYEQAVTAAGGKVTEEDRSQAEESLGSRAGFEEGGKIVQDTYLRTGAANFALQRLIPDDLQDALAAASDAYEAQLQQIYEQSKDSFELICVFAIQTTDAASAETALERIRGGEDAATVAGELAAPGGGPAQTQCLPAGSLAQSLGQEVPTEKGAIVGPVDIGGGFVSLVVDEARTQTYEEARESIAQQVQDQFTAQAEAAIDDWVREQIEAFADVTVDPRFGTWDADNLEVVPPQAPAAATTTTAPLAATPVSVAPGS